MKDRSFLGIQNADALVPEVAKEWLRFELVGNPVWAWILAIGLFLVSIGVLLLARRIAVRRLGRLAMRTTSKLDDLLVAVLADIRWWAMTAFSVFLVSQVLVLPDRAVWILRAVAMVALGIQALITSRLVIDYLIGALMQAKRGPSGEVDASLQSATTIIRFLATLFIGALTILLTLANMGIEITPLITGLGIGGVAVALASQAMLSDVFASLSILFDKPFLVGDFIIVGDKMGTVENIGVKTTRVRALSGEQLVFSNSDLLGSRIQNFKRMQQRRVVFAVGITYETPAEKVEKVPTILAEAVRANAIARLDRAHFKSFGDYALQFEVVYYVDSPDYNRYMDTQQAINLALFRRFAAEGINFAYPTSVEIQRFESQDGRPPARIKTVGAEA